MSAAGLLLLALTLTLTLNPDISDAAQRVCDRCNQEGPWWPLFKPSQIISSEFPEHAQYKRSHDFGSAEVPRKVTLRSRPGRFGVNTPLRSYKSGGRHRLEWDHYGASLVSLEDRVGGGTGPQGRNKVGSGEVVRISGERMRKAGGKARTTGESLKVRLEDIVRNGEEVTEYGERVKHSREDVQGSAEGTGVSKGQVVTNALGTKVNVGKKSASEEKKINKSVVAKNVGKDHQNSAEKVGFSEEKVSDSTERVRSSGEKAEFKKEISGEVEREAVAEQKSAYVSEQEEDSSNTRENFFNEGSFFDENNSQPGDRYADTSKASSSFETHDSSSSLEEPTKWFDPSGRSRRPVATSYSAMTSTFAPVRPQLRNLLHPEFSYSEVPNYILDSPMSFGPTRKYFVHESEAEDPGVLRIHHMPLPLAPWALHSGHQPFSRTAFQWHQETPPRHVHHESAVKHVVPTKDPFSDLGWADSRRVEYVRRSPPPPPPPVPPHGKTLFLYKKKLNPLYFKKISIRQPSFNNVYQQKNTNRLI